jgi:hypothetical protein
LAKEPRIAQAAFAMAEHMYVIAAAYDRNQSQDPPEQDSAFIQARQ